MSILVKGMEMPKNCYDCVLNHSFFRDMKCANLEGMSGFGGVLPHTNDRHPNCPLVLVPPHGRLIDADELEECKEIMINITGGSKYAVRMDDIRNMPTIIEADKET